MSEGAESTAGQRARVEQECDPGERIVWAEKPVPRFFSKTTLALAMFGFWLGTVSGMALWTALRYFGPDGAPYVPHPALMFAGSSCLVMAPLLRYRALRQTVYVVTSHRAIIFEGCSEEPPLADLTLIHRGRPSSLVSAAGFGRMKENGLTRSFRSGWPRKIYSYPHVSMRRIFFRTRRNGTGDVIFDLQSYRGRYGDKFWSERGFKDVRSPEKTWRLLNDLAKEAKLQHGAGATADERSAAIMR